MAPDHQHDWIEFGRNFPLGELAQDPDWLSPDGGHLPDVAPEGGEKGDLLPASHPKLREKVPPNHPYVALQCSDAACRHVIHVDLSSAEWKKIQTAYELGVTDPDGNGTHRALSQFSLDQLGLDRIAAKLTDEQRRLSGAVEALDEADPERFVSGDDSAVNERARETTLRALGLAKGQGEKPKGGSKT